MAEVKLLGIWYSPFTNRVIWALKLKGIPFEYVEEDLANKSSMLLHYNPVHKKVPVLIHGGKPISESMIIVKYLDETWPHHPLLPALPYGRALARFWVNFFEDKELSMWKMFGTAGEEQEKAVKATMEILKTIEEEAMEVMGENKYFGGENIGIVDIAFGGIAHWLGVLEKMVGIKIFEPHKFPKLHSWTQNFKQHPIICENLPDVAKMIALFEPRRERMLASASACRVVNQPSRS
ncbi:probable glutathione S-transferase [Euphorbia lathyris]|uniref:probable glutathione S-transferase n=1 Tax=Euphorbia lathyris TaxID=212925 RepID=UPI003313B115